MSTPGTVALPSGYRRVDWPGRLGKVAAVVPEQRGEQPGRARVLLVPGMTGSKEDFFELLGPLRGQGWWVAAADLPGMADSDGPDDASAYRLPLLAEDVVGMLQECSGGAPAHLVGHSVGGLVAREAALIAPPGLLESLTLYASGPGRVGGIAAAGATQLMTALQHYRPDEVYAMKLAQDFDLGNPAPPHGISGFLRERWLNTSPGHFIAMAQIALAQTRRDEDLIRLRTATGLPILVLYGSLDRTWPLAEFQQYAECVATAASVIEGAGHSPAVEDPSATTAALDHFWRYPTGTTGL